MRLHFGLLLCASVCLTSCAIKRPKMPKLPRLPDKPAFSLTYADDTLAFLQEEIASANTHMGDRLLVCPENRKTKLRPVIVPERYYTDAVPANLRSQTEMVWVPTPKGEAKSMCHKYNKTDTECLIEKPVSSKQNSVPSRNISIERYITYANRKGYLVSAKGKRLKKLRRHETTNAHSCEGL